MEDMGQSKEIQVSNIREIISNLNDDTVTMFTVGSSLGNPGPSEG